jgi:hypothetical protein
MALQCLALYLGVLTLWLEGWFAPAEGPDEALRRGIAAILGGPAAVHRPPTAPTEESPSRPASSRPSRGAGIFGDHDDFVD